MNSFNVTGDGVVEVGARASIGAGAQIVFAGPGRVVIGDYCTVGPNVKIVVSGGDVRIGDWTSIHDGVLILCKEGVTIGEHGWFGQGSVLDGTGGLTIGTGVRVGMYSQIWTHVAAGEQIEGCTLFGERPVVIEDDVWLVGSCICASGVTLGRRLVALIGSNIVKSHPGGIVIAGAPAAPKELSFYRPVDLQEKWHMLTGWVEPMAAGLGARVKRTDDTLTLARPDGERVVFARTAAAAAEAPRESATTVCCLETKRYSKRLTDLEQRVLKALAGNKARFLSGLTA